MIFISCMVGVGVIGIVDYVTGYEVSLSVFYTVPIIVAVWFCGLVRSFIVAALAALTWIMADSAAGHVYASDVIPKWNGCVRFSYLLMIAYGASSAKRQIQHEQARARALEGVLPICTCCRRIQDDDGYWAEMETYLAEHSRAEPSSKLCPDCARRMHISQITPGAGSASHLHQRAS